MATVNGMLTEGSGRLTLADAFAELNEPLLDDHSLAETLLQVATITQRMVPAASEVSITLVEDGRARTAAFTGSLAAQLDERQYETGYGPCLGAAEFGQTIRTDSADPGTAYPDFAQMAARAGIRHTLAVALPVPGRVVGALNLYSTSERPFDDQAESDVATFAGYVAVALANAALYAGAVDVASQLRVAMASRAVIEQAKGILMLQNGCPPEEAFAILARLSQTRNVKLRDIAEDVVQRAGSRRRHPGP